MKFARQAGLVALVALLAGCGTIDGVGQDISGAARTVQSWF
ncbi:entericidin EcnA/B family protein [Lutimaribacter sp. EGI FJ00015]|uniref:Entericidin EcnA/B family protein n=1 Tax=Lutimaribacter degradans TaxID=2945989 RepID=A0ACC5ZSQ6_9RHOB|nr:entericidin EcnA/B family protein [Lutimaribacter sp. EGI FJ00013]MCM2561180.1 entericidin EcnA/B family protein [Lutimaribacter sp. EGI FJ00013]MCO0611871.1 entericidin EcnA/B family protein [Lutimaribacter sp. EGI FJ00015]MCO0635008.1 entericidin EcnA/B family protein [Lutimaribacter sp. EGI FJ00014]